MSTLGDGRVDRVHVQIGYRTRPDGPASEQFLLDLPVAEDGARPAEDIVLAALDPAVFAGGAIRRHHSLHVHRWHDSWGVATGALEVGLTVTTGRSSRGDTVARSEVVAQVFGELLRLAGSAPATPVSRDAALVRARRSVVAAYGEDVDGLAVRVEQHLADQDAWRFSLRSPTAEYAVQVGLVDGYSASVSVRRSAPSEVHNSIGGE